MAEFHLEVVVEEFELLEVAEKGDPGTSGGDMNKAVYDPTAVLGDAFAMANMAESATAKVLTNTERAGPTQVEAETGTSTVMKLWSALRVRQAVIAWAATAASIFKGRLINYFEVANTESLAVAHTISLAAGNVQRLTLTADTVITAPAVPTGDSQSFMIHLDVGGFVVTWVGWEWTAGAPPTLNTVAGKKNILTSVPCLIGTPVWVGNPFYSEP